jgi:hypothetical protein
MAVLNTEVPDLTHRAMQMATVRALGDTTCKEGEVDTMDSLRRPVYLCSSGNVGRGADPSRVPRRCWGHNGRI